MGNLIYLNSMGLAIYGDAGTTSSNERLKEALIGRGAHMG